MDFSGAKPAPLPAGRNRPKALLVLLMLLLSSIACGRTTAESDGGGQPISGELTFDGRARSYQLFLPAGYEESMSYPLVLSLHGGGGAADEMCRRQAGIQTVADREGFIVACPQGVEGHWNDGRQIDNYAAHAEQIDDVGFLTALTDMLLEDYAVDARRVYITGFSNGGMMAFRMACERSDQITAIAPSIANLPEELDCQPSRPIPVMILNGTDDPLMPFDGGQVGTRRNPLGPVYSTEATALFWAANNGCDVEPTKETLPVKDPDDPSRIHAWSYQNCQRGAEVLLYIVEGGGHTWPGGPQYAPELLIGPTTDQANTAELIWRFFDSHN